LNPPFLFFLGTVSSSSLFRIRRTWTLVLSPCSLAGRSLSFFCIYRRYLWPGSPSFSFPVEDRRRPERAPWPSFFPLAEFLPPSLFFSLSVASESGYFPHSPVNSDHECGVSCKSLIFFFESRPPGANVPRSRLTSRTPPLLLFHDPPVQLTSLGHNSPLVATINQTAPLPSAARPWRWFAGLCFGVPFKPSSRTRLHCPFRTDLHLPWFLLQ